MYVFIYVNVYIHEAVDDPASEMFFFAGGNCVGALPWADASYKKAQSRVA
jgi:hypothetical protein